jgi:hypothetical protein
VIAVDRMRVSEVHQHRERGVDYWLGYRTGREGDLVVTVARDGSRTARTPAGGVPLWTTAVYRAEARRDGVLTWRLLRRVKLPRDRGQWESGVSSTDQETHR